jgi:hypothetical protein
MKKNVSYPNYHECFEYHGNTEIERTRKVRDNIIERDWLVFNSVDEAMEFFNEKNSQLVGYYQ